VHLYRGGGIRPLGPWPWRSSNTTLTSPTLPQQESLIERLLEVPRCDVVLLLPSLYVARVVLCCVVNLGRGGGGVATGFHKGNAIVFKLRTSGT